MVIFSIVFFNLNFNNLFIKTFKLYVPRQKFANVCKVGFEFNFNF
jgi:hypothetical protein